MTFKFMALLYQEGIDISMFKWLRSIVAVILVLALIADPVTASALTSSLSPCGRGRSPIATGARGEDADLYTREALANRLTLFTFVRQMPSPIRFLFNLIKRKPAAAPAATATPAKTGRASGLKKAA
jgi:hypothetical protein